MNARISLAINIALAELQVAANGSNVCSSIATVLRLAALAFWLRFGWGIRNVHVAPRFAFTQTAANG